MKRHHTNPILSRTDIPDIPPEVKDVSSVFNPGATMLGDEYYLLLRVQTRGRRTVLLYATSVDGEQYTVAPELVRITGLDTISEQLFHIYDPRLTRLEGDLFAVFAMDTAQGCRLAIARLIGPAHYELVSFDPSGDRRNGVLFPEKINGKYLRLERPNEVKPMGQANTGNQIMLAESSDLVTWHEVGPVMGGQPHYWDELVGSGPPPIKTHAGWLHIYHGIATHFSSVNIYQAGVVLLDLSDPCQVIGRSAQNILEPREPYELMGQVPNVVFPSGMIVEQNDPQGCALNSSPVKIYYGAADTCIGLATTTVRALLDCCEE